jgi:hypothetical protein
LFFFEEELLINCEFAGEYNNSKFEISPRFVVYLKKFNSEINSLEDDIGQTSFFFINL